MKLGEPIPADFPEKAGLTWMKLSVAEIQDLPVSKRTLVIHPKSF
jgi:hypothetical protein